MQAYIYSLPRGSLCFPVSLIKIDCKNTSCGNPLRRNRKPVSFRGQQPLTRITAILGFTFTFTFRESGGSSRRHAVPLSVRCLFLCVLCFMVTPLDSLCSSACWAQRLHGSAAMATLPSLSTLGRICGSSNSDDTLVLDRVKRKNSVRRMSIIEDGEIAEVLYLIPKQSMMEQLPFLNPNDYILCEKMAGMPFEPPQGRHHTGQRCTPGCWD